MSLLNNILEQGNHPEIETSELRKADLLKDVGNLARLLPIFSQDQLNQIWNKVPENRKRSVLLSFCIGMDDWLTKKYDSNSN